MCKKRNNTEIPFVKNAFGNNAKVDDCLVNDILKLNTKGKKSIASCCGHNIYKRTIVIKSKERVYEYFSNITIPRKKRPYKMDRKGYYFIPEVENE